MVQSKSWAIAAAICLCTSVALAQTILYVDDDAPAGGNGSSWSTAYTFLQDALSDARNAPGTVAEIRLAAGIYRPDQSELMAGGSGSQRATFEIVDGTSIVGGYAGYSSLDPNERDVSRYRSVLTGDLAGNDLIDDPATWAENARHVLQCVRVASSTELSGVTIMGGYAGGSVTPGNVGAGMLNSTDCDILVTDCKIQNNRSLGDGGGIYSAYNRSRYVRCSFEANRADSSGGAAYIVGSYTAFDNCMFDANQANYGGAVTTTEMPTDFSRCMFRSNYASTSGGATFNDSFAGSSYRSCAFWMNSALAGGAIANSFQASATVLNSTFVDNSATVTGGAVRSVGSDTAAYIVNTILWANVPDQVYDVQGAATTVETSIVEGGWDGQGAGNIVADPAFLPGALQPVWDSPCRDAGNTAVFTVASAERDVGNNDRLVGAAIDIGAYEICEDSLNCDDGDPCTDDLCDNGVCNHTPSELCQPPVSCDPRPCQSVSGTSGTCVYTDLADGTSCDDGNACTADDQCANGACSGIPVTCDDGLFCNGTETCDTALGCRPGVPVDCNDGVDCTADLCNEDTDSCDNTPNDGLCDDGLFCNGAETCDAVLGCLPGADPCESGFCSESLDACVDCLGNADCDDGNDCTDDVCDASGSCVHTDNTSACTPNGTCAGVGVCDAGVCMCSAQTTDIDVAMFVYCMNLPNPLAKQECRPLDVNGDRAIDLADFADLVLQ